MHITAIDIGLDLPPERVAGSAAGEPDLIDADAHLADQLQAVAHRERGSLEHGADQVRPAMPNGQANPTPLGVGIEVRGPFTGQVGQEEEALPGPARAASALRT